MDIERDLNPAQREAVLRTDGPVLVIAGAGSGKTRTIVYRLAHLVRQGCAPADILLLTFTRKAAQEMLARAAMLMDQGLSGVSGGTFHSLAYMLIRRHAALLGRDSFTIMDRADALDILGQAKDELGLGKGDRSFPKRDTILELTSKARNKEQKLDDVLTSEALHLLPHAEAIRSMAEVYGRIKAQHGLLDYDDLLFTLERLLTDNPELRARLRERYRYIMVDEYQDTNLVQARLVQLLAGETGNVLAVGDDAQSIYAFRGASVANILNFPKVFPGAAVIRLEQNYRSTQPILDLSNEVLRHMGQKFDKHLFTEREGGPVPRVVKTLSDATQAQVALAYIQDFRQKYLEGRIAVLFRAGYQSYSLEVLLAKHGVRFQKYGGIRFSEAAHIKDVLAYLRLVANGSDMPAWQRVLKHIKGVGPRTATAIFQAIMAHDDKAMAKHRKRFADLAGLLELLDTLKARPMTPAQTLDMAVTWYKPVLIRDYPDDYPRREQGLEQLGRIATNYQDLQSFLADMSLENPEDDHRAAGEDAVVLSTIHSAKGLEWDAVIILDLVEDRFPSRRALSRPDDLEEERRLLYVACTRARESLTLLVPETVYTRGLESRAEPVRPSPFLLELPRGCVEEYRETFSGGVQPVAAKRMAADPYSAPAAARDSHFLPDYDGPDEGLNPRPAENPGHAPDGVSPAAQPGWRLPDPPAPRTGSLTRDPATLGYCTHKIYGRGKIIAEISPGKFRVNFSGFGPKVILGDYLQMEQP